MFLAVLLRILFFTAIKVTSYYNVIIFPFLPSCFSNTYEEDILEYILGDLIHPNKSTQTVSDNITANETENITLQSRSHYPAGLVSPDASGKLPASPIHPVNISATQSSFGSAQTPFYDLLRMTKAVCLMGDLPFGACSSLHLTFLCRLDCTPAT